MNPGKPNLIRVAWSSAFAMAALGTLIRMGANVLLLPLILRLLSTEQQALWWVFLSLGALANLTDFGFGQVISRVYGFLWAGAEDVREEGLTPSNVGKEPNYPRLRILNHTVRHLYFWVCMVATGLLIVGGTLSLLKPISAMAHPEQAWLAWWGYLAAVAFSIFTGHWVLACGGVNRVRDVHLAYTVGGIAYVVAAATLLFMGAGLYALILATLARSVCTWIISRRSYLAAVPDDPQIAGKVDPELLKKLWPNAKKFGLMALSGYLVSQANMMIGSHHLSVEQLAAYGVTVQVVTFLVSFSYLWLNVKWPQITILRAQGELEKMSRLFARRLALVVVTFLLGALGVLLVGPTFLTLIHAKSSLLPWEQCLVYLVWSGLQILPVHFGQLVFTENVVPFYRLSIFAGVLCAVLTMLLTPVYGLNALLWVPLIVETTCIWWYVVLRGFKGQPLNLRDFLRAFFWQTS